MNRTNRHELVVGGTGGQGVLTLAYTIAAAATQEYRYVSRFPIYLGTQRGGSAFATVIFSHQEIPAPILSRAFQTIAMESGAYSRLKKETKPGGRLFVNSSIVKKVEPAADYTVYEIPVTDLAQELGAPQMANIVMLGAYRTVTGILSDELMIETLAKEGGEARRDKNREAYERGVAYAREKGWTP